MSYASAASTYLKHRQESHLHSSFKMCPKKWGGARDIIKYIRIRREKNPIELNGQRYEMLSTSGLKHISLMIYKMPLFIVLHPLSSRRRLRPFLFTIATTHTTIATSTSSQQRRQCWSSGVDCGGGH